MKKTITLLLLCFTIFVNAQDLVKTTYEEYQFLTESFAYQDNVKMLEGYEFQPLIEETKDVFNFNIKRFVFKSTGETKAIFVKITKIKKNEDKVRYLCLPINNPDLFSKYESDVYKLGSSMWYTYDTLNRELVMSLINDLYNKD